MLWRGRDAQGVVAVLGGQVVEHLPLVGSHHAARDAAADHDQPLLAGLAQVAIVLLIDAMELDELLIVLGKFLEGRSFRVAAILPASVGIRCFRTSFLERGAVVVSDMTKRTLALIIRNIKFKTYHID
ncbi:MAG: hypothetical protein WDM96_01265 [Lacunisphaera sp.]